MSTLEIISRHFKRFGYKLQIDRDILPSDRTTLFICSGMQEHKRRFREPDGGRFGSLQSCIRTRDLDLVGDGSHLTHFEMLGNFSFGNDDYEESIELWHGILRDLKIPVTHITFHPSCPDHEGLWRKRGYRTVPDESCRWSDGDIGGECCEVFVGDLELGNLVNPLGRSVDVGFGFERLIQVIEGQDQVHKSSLFRQDLHPIVSDHLRSLELMRANGISPGSKGRGYVCRRLVQRLLPHIDGPGDLPSIADWIRIEEENQDKRVRLARRKWKKFGHRGPEFWRETYGVTPEDLGLIRP